MNGSPVGSRAGWRAGVAGALALLITLATGACTVLDISNVQTLDLQPPSEGSVTPSVVAGFGQNYLGRVAMDVAVTNTGEGSAAFVLSAQAQTSGADTDDACPLFRSSTNRELIAVPQQAAAEGIPDGNASLVRDFNDAFEIVMPSDGAASLGFVEIRVRRVSDYQIFANDAVRRLRLFTGEGVEILPTSYTTAVQSCESAGVSGLWSLTAGAYSVLIETTGSTVRPILYATEDCRAQRRVSRTCPGTASEIVTIETPTLPAGDTFSRRLFASELGIGDEVVVEFGCADASPTCLGVMDAVFVTEELQCRGNSDCPGSASCSSDGYCIRPATGCAVRDASQGGGRFGMVLVAGLLTLLGRRRRLRSARRGSGLRTHAAALALAGALTAIGLVVPADALAQGRTAQVDFEAGMHMLVYTGALGRASSPGLGLRVAQSASVGRVGFGLSLASESYLTNQPAPPLVRGLQAFTVTVGPRYTVDLPWIRIVGILEYLNASFASNGLVRYTGDRRNHSGVGAGLGIRYEGLAPLYVQVQPLARVYLTMPDAAFQWGFSISVGLTGGR